ncbi:type II/IV secretion system protein [Candidatus Kaiserbacteria bacterium]|nr:type II/IV secretion system protein [Candidatus Kaiserbacteria bacterium]
MTRGTQTGATIEGKTASEVVELLLADAVAVRASDIHLDPNETGIVVRRRTDGRIEDHQVLPRSMHAEIISRIKILCCLRTDEHQAAQDGRFRHTTDAGAAVDVRVSIVPTYHGENAVLRLLYADASEHSLESLGFSAAQRSQIARALDTAHGMILATGPTGSGKTTTLYTLVRMARTPGVSLVTIEDPIEYAIPGVSQIQVNPRTGLSFGTGLRAIVRQDPDVIMVGEIRDQETASLAVNTALTGHLLFSTLHTNDAATTLPRLLDMGVEPYLIASTVNACIGQRLARRICRACKEPYRLTDTQAARLAEVAGPDDPAVRTRQFYRGAGCAACAGAGTAGRIGIYEVLVVDEAVRDAVLLKAPARTVAQIAMRHGMTTMRADALAKAAEGEIALEEVFLHGYA